MTRRRVVELHYRYTPTWGYTRLVGPGQADLQYLEVGLLRLQAGQVYEETTAGQEVALTLLSGACDIRAGSQHWPDLHRRDPFRDWERPTTAYVPIQTPLRVEARSELEIAVSKALTDFQGQPGLIRPEEVRNRVVGRGQPWQWEIHFCLPRDYPSGRLFVGEDLSLPGNWCSYPPHKHDQDRPPDEANMEEVFFYKLDPRQGFGLQRVYTADGSFDRAYVVKENDCVALPWGHHPAVAAGGYRLFFVWSMARSAQPGGVVTDPEHAWLRTD